MTQKEETRYRLALWHLLHILGKLKCAPIGWSKSWVEADNWAIRVYKK